MLFNQVQPDLAWMALVSAQDAGVGKVHHDDRILPESIECTAGQNVKDQGDQSGISGFMDHPQDIPFTECPWNKQREISAKVLQAKLNHHRAYMGSVWIGHCWFTKASGGQAIQMQKSGHL